MMMNDMMKAELLSTLEQLDSHAQQRVLDFARDLAKTNNQSRERGEQKREADKFIWEGGSQSAFRGH